MLLLFIAMSLTNTQQAKHDQAELTMYRRLQDDQARIADIWHPSAKLVSDLSKARACYTKFHLYKGHDCETELSQVERHLGEVELAQGRDQ
jgi:hypothetical protein